MIGCIRESGLVAPLAAGALMATVLIGVSACGDPPLGVDEETAARPAEVDAAPVTAAHHVPAPEERMPPPFQAAEPWPATPPPREKPALMLTVEPGDSLGAIAQRYGVAARTIIAMNDLSDPYWLLTGQRLALPLDRRRVGYDDDLPAEKPRRVQHVTAASVPEIEIEPAGPIRVEPEDPAHAEDAVPVRAGRTPPVRAEVQIPEPSDSPAPRAARAEPDATPLAPTLYALARQPDTNGVPLPPTRNTFLWPIEGRVISGFGAKPGGKHNDGINIAAPVGSEVRAAQTGVVAYAGNELRGYGNLVLIRHDGGWMTAYAHNDALLVGKGDVVNRGQVISHSGRSGSVSRPQTHFEIRRDGEPQDPLRLLTRK